MTLNWGHKIAIVYIAFVLFMLFMLYKSNQANFQLVTKDYYKDELAYQQVIDGTNRANTLSSTVQIKKLEDAIIIQLPIEMKGNIAQGEIWFYCITNNKNDKRLKLTINNEAMHIIKAGIINPGNYKVKINWEAAGLNYYSEQSFIQP